MASLGQLQQHFPLLVDSYQQYQGAGNVSNIADSYSISQLPAPHTAAFEIFEGSRAEDSNADLYRAAKLPYLAEQSQPAYSNLLPNSNYVSISRTEGSEYLSNQVHNTNLIDYNAACGLIPPDQATAAAAAAYLSSFHQVLRGPTTAANSTNISNITSCNRPDPVYHSTSTASIQPQSSMSYNTLSNTFGHLLPYASSACISDAMVYSMLTRMIIDVLAVSLFY